MIGVGIVGAIVVGLLAGFIAEQLMGGNHGLLTNLVVGLIGALIGPVILGAIGMMPADAGFLPSLAISTVGALVFLFVLRLFQGRAAV
jgi:uncharacterized membrane protein YeaQ/YmgE (transglycosylase-associated protein family)